MALAVLAACGGQTEPSRAVPSVDTAGYAFGQAGDAMRVSRPAQPLTYSDGLAAKRAAQAYCAGQGARLNPAAFGHFSGGYWAFAGGCQ